MLHDRSRNKNKNGGMSVAGKGLGMLNLPYLIRVLRAKLDIGGVDITVTYSPHPGRCRNGIRDCGVLILKLVYSKCTVDDGVILRLVRELTRVILPNECGKGGGKRPAKSDQICQAWYGTAPRVM